MAYIPQQNLTGLFIPTTSNFEIAAIFDIDVNSKEFKELIVRLYQNQNNIALSLNLKDSAYYLQEEFVTGAQFYNTVTLSELNTRPEFRKAFNTGALGAGVTTVAHGLTIGTTWTFTDIWGTATDNVGNNYYPLPWSSAAGATNIELRVNAANIVIT